MQPIGYFVISSKHMFLHAPSLDRVSVCMMMMTSSGIFSIIFLIPPRTMKNTQLGVFFFRGGFSDLGIPGKHCLAFLPYSNWKSSEFKILLKVRTENEALSAQCRPTLIYLMSVHLEILILI